MNDNETKEIKRYDFVRIVLRLAIHAVYGENKETFGMTLGCRLAGNCTLLAVDNEPDRFMLGGEVMDCAPGSTFSLTMCTCVYVEPRK